MQATLQAPVRLICPAAVATPAVEPRGGSAEALPPLLDAREQRLVLLEAKELSASRSCRVGFICATGGVENVRMGQVRLRLLVDLVGRVEDRNRLARTGL